MILERYCVDSGRAVGIIPGDRCLRHGDSAEPCFTALREARCQHPHLSPNHPYPHCSECGRDLDRAGNIIIGRRRHQTTEGEDHEE